uniref:PAS domain-containing protein n=1 Tax=Parascaris equorum TaxID=6256 RepID=A0A914S2W4_PAREQ
MALKALGGFILILNENGEIYYASENIETYLGFHQSDILHQSLFEMIHSEDREDIKQQLAWNYNIPPHVTCLQDLLTPDIRGKLMSLHGLPHSFVLGRSDANSSGNTVLGLYLGPLLCTLIFDRKTTSPLKTNKLLSLKRIAVSILELLWGKSTDFHSLLESIVHVDDALCLAEAHKEENFLHYLNRKKRGEILGLFLLPSRVFSFRPFTLLNLMALNLRSRRIYWIQSSCRMFYKNGKPESIGLTHRLLT